MRLATSRRAADHVDRFARLLPQRAELVDVANDPRRRPGRFGERRREHEMRRLGGDPRVGELARVRIPAEHVRGGGRVVEDRRPEALVVGEHAAAEHEGVDRRQQLEAVSPGVDPIDLALGAEDASVERHLHRGDQSLVVEVLMSASSRERGPKRNRWLHVERSYATTGCGSLLCSRRPRGEEASGWCPTESAERSSSTRSPDEVWAIVTEPRHVARWFSDEAEIDLRPGGAMLLTWHGHGTYRGRVDAVDPPHRFAFRWLRREDNEPGDGTSTLVEFILVPEGCGHEAPRRRKRLPTAGLVRRGQGPIRRRERRRLGPRAQPAPRLRSRPRQQPRRFMTGEGEEADRLWAAIADPTRQQLLDRLLASGDATATALARDLPITRQGIAKHLAVLERAGLVEATRTGREVRFTVREDRLDQATRRMAQILARWDERLATIKRIAESDRESPHRRPPG